MKRKLKEVPKPTLLEAEKLKNFIWMADWHFETTIKDGCTEIESFPIYWKNTKEYKWVNAFLFGLNGMRTVSEESCIANMFIRFEGRLYQMRSVVDAAELIRLLKKEASYKEYQEKLWKQKWEEREKIIAAKEKERTEVKRLKVGMKKKAA